MPSIAWGMLAITSKRFEPWKSIFFAHEKAQQDPNTWTTVKAGGFDQVLGGRFRSVMPSDLFAPGAMAVMSLPSPGARYAGDASRDKLRQMYQR